jgi:enolase-phosphatase E1
LTVAIDRNAIAAIVLDIEGTTTPIAFVRDVLFPYARRHLGSYLRGHESDPEAAGVIDRLRRDSAGRGVAAHVEALMDQDAKSTDLKLLQGLIWLDGYASGELQSELYHDVVPAIERWRAAGLKVAIYSSGSVLAQRLLFSHTTQGDVTPLFDAFFDTIAGAKIAPASYRGIADALGCTTEHLLFVSDSTAELEAAREAGCRVAWCVRSGNPTQVPRAPVDVIYTLDDLRFTC